MLFLYVLHSPNCQISQQRAQFVGFKCGTPVPSAAGGVPSSRPILTGHIPASDSLIIYNLISKLMADFGLLTSLIDCPDLVTDPRAGLRGS
jgi:hypothetical protein